MRYKSLQIDGFGQVRIGLANTFMPRVRGLLFREALDGKSGLLLSPCNSVHTFFMKYDLDIFFLDKEFRVVKVVKNLGKQRVSFCLSASHVLEVSHLSALSDYLGVGDVLPFLEI